MAEFIQIPSIRWIGGKYPWRLDSDLIYKSDVLDRVIVVPKGYCTDLASVPRLPFLYWRTGGRANMAAVVHDHLYDCWTKRITRKQADMVFREAMDVIGEPRRKLTRWVMYRGVRVGGWLGWRTDTTHKCIKP